MNFDTDFIVRIVVALLSVVFIFRDFISYCKQKINERFAFGWGVFGLAVFLACVVPQWSGWSTALSGSTYAVIIVLGVLLTSILFSLSQLISQLTAKNQELAMQVSLLNNENARMLRTIKEITGKDVLDTEK